MTTRQLNSDEGIGEQQVLIALSPGWYSITMASIYVPSNYSHEAHMGFDVEQGDGTFIGAKLMSGYASYGKPLCLSSTRMVEGPGRLYSTVYHLESEQHIFQIQLTRLEVGPL